MKKTTVIFTLLFFFISIIISCDNHHSSNGDLDGFWQMTEIEGINGCNIDFYDLPMYWSFEVNLMEIRKIPKEWGIFFRFNHTQDSLIISEPLQNNRDSGDIKILTSEPLRHYGIFHLREGFAVEQFSNSTMILKSDSVRARFRKY